MATDVRLDAGDDASWVAVAANVLKIEGSDLIIDSADRRTSGGGTYRRALVHDQNDGLTINFAGDYAGGITLHDVAGITPRRQDGQFTPDLIVHGGISFEVEVINTGGGIGEPGRIEDGLVVSEPTGPGPITRRTLSLIEVLEEFKTQVEALTERVTVLEAAAQPPP